MKTTLLALLLVLSLAGNAALYLARDTGVDSSAKVSSLKTSDAKGDSAFGDAASTTKSAVNPSAASANLWTKLYTTDLAALTSRLRSAGFTPAMIRAIIAAEVQQQFAARRKALMAQQEDVPFWKNQQRYLNSPAVMSGLRDLQREQSKLLKQLLGEDSSVGKEEMQMYQRRQFGDLSREKVDEVQSITGDYGDLRSHIYAASNGILLPEDREKLSLLDKEQRADLAAVLTPQEIENYELRSSTTANVMRSQLALFNPTEDEFRALFKLQQAYDDKYPSSGVSLTPDQMRQRQQELLAQAQGVLTPDRLELYKQATDPSSQMVNRLVARLELPASAATRVVSLQQDIQKRAAVIRSDKTLAVDARNLQLSALAQEATTKLTATLGTRGLEAYKQYGGQWVQNIVPRQP